MRGVERVMEKNKNITIIARNLRKRSTDAERLLWKYLSSKKMEGLKFRRQQPIGKYIVDFVCFEKRILIEVDGGQHAREVLFLIHGVAECLIKRTGISNWPQSTQRL